MSLRLPLRRPTGGLLGHPIPPAVAVATLAVLFWLWMISVVL